MRALLFIATMLACSTFGKRRPDDRTGGRLWIGVGVGDGFCQDRLHLFLFPVARHDFSGLHHLGKTLSPHVRLGGEVNRWGLVTPVART